jgi:hypothetical protein
MGCGTNIVPGFDAVNKQVKDYPLEMKIMSEFNASESNKNYDVYQDEAFDRTVREDLSPTNIDDVLMSDEIDHQALREYGAELPRGAEGFILGDDKMSHSPVEKGSQKDGRYYWFLFGGTRGKALKYLLNWGRPNKVTFNESRVVKPSAFYDAREDRIVTKTWASSRGPIYPTTPGDILRTLLHETFHWADYALGRHNYPELQRSWQPKPLSVRDKAFRKAFYDDAKALGLTDFDKQGWWNKPTMEIAEEHDAALAEMIMYDYLLDHPKQIDLGTAYLRQHLDANQMNKTHPLISLGIKLKLANKRASSLANEYSTEWQFGDFRSSIINSPLAKYVNKYGHLPDRFEITQMHSRALRQVALTLEMADIIGQRSSIGREISAELGALFEKTGNLTGYMDILDAMSGGVLHDSKEVYYGHGSAYYTGLTSRLKETFANLGEAWSNQDIAAWKRMKEKLPNLTREFERIMEENKDARIAPKVFD